jgi:hypothetical protein
MKDELEKFFKMKSMPELLNRVFQICSVLLILGCESENPTIFSVDVVDLNTGNKIPGATLLLSIYEKPASIMTLPGIIRTYTIQTDNQGYFRLLVPYDERYSRFTISALKKVGNDTYEFVNSEDGCNPYDCSSFRPGQVYKFKLKTVL